MSDAREAIEKSRYQELIEKIQEAEQTRLITKLLEAKLEMIKDRFLVESADKLEALQLFGRELEEMVIDLNIQGFLVDE